MTAVLVTGGAGFIGANFVKSRILDRWDSRSVVVLDALTYAGNKSHLEEVEDRITFVQGDIADLAVVRDVFDRYKIDQVVHFAAESHVDNSIADPGVFVRTNVVGTFVLLETARAFWMAAPFQVRPEFKSARFLHVSTDEVYGTLAESGTFTESSPLAPNSPYSATKAGSD